MTDPTDTDRYFADRAVAEREMARKASKREAIRAHTELAERYSDRCRDQGTDPSAGQLR